MTAGKDGRKQPQQARFRHGLDYADLQLPIVEPGVWRDPDASTEVGVLAKVTTIAGPA